MTDRSSCLKGKPVSASELVNARVDLCEMETVCKQVLTRVLSIFADTVNPRANLCLLGVAVPSRFRWAPLEPPLTSPHGPWSLFASKEPNCKDAIGFDSDSSQRSSMNPNRDTQSLFTSTALLALLPDSLLTSLTSWYHTITCLWFGCKPLWQFNFFNIFYFVSYKVLDLS